MKKLFVFGITALLFSGCYFIPCNFEDGLVKIENKKDESFFIGKYILDESIHNKYDYSKASIILKKNGILEVYNISSKTFYPYRMKEQVISAKGNWRLIYVKSREDYRLSLSIKFQKVDSMENLGLSNKLYLKNKKPVILFEIGDPDECKAVRFIKE